MSQPPSELRFAYSYRKSLIALGAFVVGLLCRLSKRMSHQQIGPAEISLHDATSLKVVRAGHVGNEIGWAIVYGDGRIVVEALTG